MKQEIKFPEYSCRFHCPHFQSVGPTLNETHYCMKKGKKGKRFLKKDLKRKPPEWCPLRLDPPVCRIYGFKDILGESMERDNRLSTDPDQVSWYFPIPPHAMKFRTRDEAQDYITTKLPEWARDCHKVAELDASDFTWLYWGFTSMIHAYEPIPDRLLQATPGRLRIWRH